MLARLSLAVLAPLFALVLFTGSAQAVGCISVACFWVGGTGTLDMTTDSAHWSTTTGGGTCSCEPNSTSSLVFDGSSGGGTVTVTVPGGTLSVVSITWGAFTGTLDFATSDNNVTLSSNTGFSGSGTGSGRIISLGDGTWTLTGTGAVWNMQTLTNLSAFNANASTIVFTATTANLRTFTLGASLTYNDISIGANTSGGSFRIITGSSVVSHLAVTAPNALTITSGGTLIITNPYTWTGTGSANSQISLGSDSFGSRGTLSVTNAGAAACSWCGIRDMAFSGGATFSAPNSFDLGNNSGAGIVQPVVGGSGGGGIIGG